MTPASKIGKKAKCAWPGCDGGNREFCFCESFAGKHPEVAAQWHPEKNKNLFNSRGKKLPETPDKYLSKSTTKVWWLCPVICNGCKKQHEWYSDIKHRTDSKDPTGCRHCNPTCIIEPHCYEKSFAGEKPELVSEWWEKNEGKPENFRPTSNIKKAWVCPKTNCDFNCKHLYVATINKRYYERKCPYCRGRKVCVHNSILCKRPDVMKLWYTKLNMAKKNPIHASNTAVHSTKRAYFKCLTDPSHVWKTAVQNLTKKNPSGCPYCYKKTEAKLNNWLLEKYSEYTINRQKKFIWCKNPSTNVKMPFDFRIKELKLLIELDGPQHFQQISRWEPPEIVRKRDKIKMELAIKNNYSLIRILQKDVLEDLNNWEYELTEYIESFNNNSDKTPEIIFICSNNEYDVYDSDNDKKVENNNDSDNDNAESEDKDDEIKFLKKMEKINDDEIPGLSLINMAIADIIKYKPEPDDEDKDFDLTKKILAKRTNIK